MEQQYNMRNPAVKRLMKEAQELNDSTEQYFAQPLEDNLFEWHFTIRGPADTEFEGGIYHGRIILPPGYPMKPPSIILLTSQGRFELHTKICLSISGHHPESWQPSWSIRTALLAIIGFMPTHGAGAIGSLDYTTNERKKLARKSRDWCCPQCGNIVNLLKPVTEASRETEEEIKQLASQINFQGERQKSENDSSKGDESNPAVTAATAATAATDTSVPQVDRGPGDAPSAETPSSMAPGVPPVPPPCLINPSLWQNSPSAISQNPLTSPHTPVTSESNSANVNTSTTVSTPNTLHQPSTPEIRQRATTAPPGGNGVELPVSRSRTVIVTQYDYVSVTILFFCCLFITLILIRRLGIVDSEMMYRFYKYL